MFTNFFNRQGRTLLMLAAVLVVGTVCLPGCGGGKADTQAKQAAHWKERPSKNEWGDVTGHYYEQTVEADVTRDGDLSLDNLKIAYFGGSKLMVIVATECTLADGAPVEVVLRDAGANETVSRCQYDESNSGIESTGLFCDDIGFVQALQKNADYKILVRLDCLLSKGTAMADIKGGLPIESGQTPAANAQAPAQSNLQAGVGSDNSALPAKLDLAGFIGKAPSCDVRIWGWSNTGKMAFSKEYTSDAAKKLGIKDGYYILDITTDKIVGETQAQNGAHGIVYGKTELLPFPLTQDGYRYDCRTDVKFKEIDMDLSGEKPDYVTTVDSYKIIVSRSDGKKKTITAETLEAGDMHLYTNVKVCGYVKSPYENRIVVIAAVERTGYEEQMEWKFNGCNLEAGFK
jgi:hypothetical protein